MINKMRKGDSTLQKRKLGNTGEMLSIIGFGGIVAAQVEQKDANNYVAEAIDRGINYFDVAPSYMDAEDRLGPALYGKRNNIFLACKTGERNNVGAREELEQSLKKLKTDHFDLYQMHGVASVEEAETILGPNGALETFLKAQQEGLIRYIGFSAHSEEAASLLMDNFDFTSVLFPLNWVNMFNSKFGEKILKKADEKGVARLALKAMAKTVWPDDADKKYPKCWYEPIDDKDLAGLALRYTLSKPITAAIPPGDIRLFRWALETAENFTPISQDEEDELKNLAKGLKPIFPN